MSESWRCFVAVPIGDDLRGQLTDAMQAWRDDPRTDGLHWVAPDALHVTLAFLGGVEPDRIPAVSEAIGTVAARHRRVTRTTGRLGAFARPGSARVLWYGVGDEDGALAELADDLAAALHVQVEDAYRPHITLARARRRWIDLRGWIEEASEAAPRSAIEVEAMQLMRSHLGRGPARYETLASFPLGGGR